ncbi:MAG: hypothetical protein ACJ77E_11270 [Gaiellaceae bacterium]
MRTAVAFVVAIASAATIATVGRTAPADAGPNQAKLKLMATDPVAVRGLAFRPGERVSVLLRLSTDATWTQKTTASQTGVFNAVFSGARAGHCTGITVRATGRSGSTAVFHRIPLPACMVD